MAERRNITLIGDFEDNITPALKKINTLLESIGGKKKKGVKAQRDAENPFFRAKRVLDDIEDVQRGLKGINKQLHDIGNKKVSFGKGGLEKANEELEQFQKRAEALAKGIEIPMGVGGLDRATEDADKLSRMLNAEHNMSVGVDGLDQATEQAGILHDLLHAAAAIEVGKGLGDSFKAGIASVQDNLNKFQGFVKHQFHHSMEDQVQDVQAVGRLYGAFSSKKMFRDQSGMNANQSKMAMESDFQAAKNVHRAVDTAMGSMLAASVNPTETINMFERQAGQEILPILMKAAGIGHFDKFRDENGKMSRDRMDDLMATSGVADRFARVLDKMAGVTPDTYMAHGAIRAYTEYLTNGTVNQNRSLFMQNPAMYKAMVEGNSQDPAKRMEALEKALEFAMPQAALDMAKNTFKGTFQFVNDQLFSPTMGKLAMGASVASQGNETLRLGKETGALSEMIKLRTEQYDRDVTKAAQDIEKQKKVVAKTKDPDILKGAQQTLKFFEERHANLVKNRAEEIKRRSEQIEYQFRGADEAIELLELATVPALQSLGRFFATLPNLFIKPAEAIFKNLAEPLTSLALFIEEKVAFIEDLPDDIAWGDLLVVWAEAAGEIAGKTIEALEKAISGVADDADAGAKLIERIIAAFMKGFNKFDGSAHVKTLIDAVTDTIVNLLFKEGKWYKGVNSFVWTLVKVFAILAAPAVIASLIGTAITTIGIMLSSALISGVQGALGKLGVSKAAQATGAAARARRSGLTGTKALQGGKVGMTKALKIPAPAKTVAAAGKTSATLAKSAGPMAKFSAGLKAVGPRLMILGGIFETLIKLLDGKSPLEALSSGIGAAGGMKIGAIIGTMIAGPIGTVLGALIGAELGKLAPVTNFIEGVLKGFGSAMKDVVGPIVPIFSEIGLSLSELIKTWPWLNNIFRETGENVTALKAGFWAIKFVLFPIVAGLDLILVALKVTNIALKAFQGGLNQVHIWFRKLTGQSTTEQEKQSEVLKQEHSALRSKLDETLFNNSIKYDNYFNATIGAMGEASAAQAAAAAAMTQEKATNKYGSEDLAFIERIKKVGDFGDFMANINQNLASGNYTTEQANGLRALVEKARAVEIAHENLATKASNVGGNLATYGETHKITKKAVEEHTKAQAIYDKAVADASATWVGSNDEVKTQLGLASGTLASSANSMATALTIHAERIAKITARQDIETRPGKLPPPGGPGSTLITPTEPNLPPKSGFGFAEAYAGNYPKNSPLGMAIQSEMKNKPAGSDLVIANSSETIIPAYLGHSPQESPFFSKKDDGGVLPCFKGVERATSMPLMQAIETEKQHMPSGAELVIANSSETIIPAYSGNGVEGLFGLIGQGFSILTKSSDNAKDQAQIAGTAAVSRTEELSQQTSTQMASLDNSTAINIKGAESNLTSNMGSGFESTFSNIEQATSGVLSGISDSHKGIMKGLSDVYSSLSRAISSISLMGGMMGGGGGTGSGYGSAGVALAAGLGFFVKSHGLGAHRQDSHGGRPTSGHANGSYHYDGRAIDIPGMPDQHPRILALVNQYNAAKGVRPVELLHNGNDPKGHWDHVHVAYGYGSGNPAFFSSATAADKWEMSMAKNNPIISSVRARADEVGTNQTNTFNVVIHQQPGQDAEEMAAIVADKISMALESQIGKTIL